MIAVLKPNATKEQREHLISWLERQELEVHISEGKDYTVLGLVGDTSLHAIERQRHVKRRRHHGDKHYHRDEQYPQQPVAVFHTTKLLIFMKNLGRWVGFVNFARLF